LGAYSSGAAVKKVHGKAAGHPSIATKISRGEKQIMANEFDGKKVLIIDDEQDVLEYLKTFLGDLGFKTYTALDALEGSQIAKQEKPDVITLDISMPEKSGGKFLKELQADSDIAHIPVIVVTGVMKEYKSFIHTRKFIKPPDGYIQKPIDRDEMIKTLRDILGT
jgi:CheY-like chemotaxis protein